MNMHLEIFQVLLLTKTVVLDFRQEHLRVFSFELTWKVRSELRWREVHRRVWSTGLLSVLFCCLEQLFGSPLCMMVVQF